MEPNKLKIVVLGTSFPLRGGLAAYNERLARQLIVEGHDVTMVTFKLQYPSFLFPGKSQYSDANSPDDLNIHVWMNSVNPFNWIRTGRRIRNMNADLILVKFWLPFMGPCFGTILRKAKKNGISKVISILDNVIPHEKRMFDRPFTRWFVKPVDAFIAMSENVLNDLNQFNTYKARILSPHPLYDHFGGIMPRKVALQQLNLSESNKYLLFFGLIRDYKGLDILLEAMALPQLADPSIQLIIAGEFYSDPTPYHQLIDRNNLSQRVHLHAGFIPDNKVALYFSAADIVVQPYKNATQSGVTQIAYHFEKPMIVSCVGGLPEMVPDGIAGRVVNPAPEAIADAILEMLPDESLSKYAQGVSNEKSKYSWEKLSESIMKIYKKI